MWGNYCANLSRCDNHWDCNCSSKAPLCATTVSHNGKVLQRGPDYPVATHLATGCLVCWWLLLKTVTGVRVAQSKHSSCVATQREQSCRSRRLRVSWRDKRLEMIGWFRYTRNCRRINVNILARLVTIGCPQSHDMTSLSHLHNLQWDKGKNTLSVLGDFILHK